MTSINVGGRFLDLPEELQLQFVKKNIYYSFDNIETERTLSFSIPKTPNNIFAFNLAHLPQAYGEAMRTRVAAQLQMGIVVKDGYLYVDSYSQGVFDCIFITGELLGLKEIKELGDWSLFISQADGVALNAETLWAYQSSDNPTGRVEYRTDGDIKPSWLFPYYAQQAAQNANIDVDWGEVLTTLAGHRIVVGNPRGAKETSITLARIYETQPSAETPYPTLNSVSGDVVNVIDTRLSAYPIFIYDQEAVQYYGYVQEFVALQDLTLRFADDTSEDVFLGSAQQNGTFAFLGDYSFAADGFGGYATTGDPLAGRDVDIPAGTTFVLLTQTDLQLPASGYEGWKISAGTLEASVVVSGGEQSASAFVRVCDNLPEMTIVDMLKIVAALSGTILNYKDGTISFVSNVVEGETVELRRAIKRSNLRRTFGDYAQRNIIAFDSDNVQPLRTIYTIDNVNIEKEKTLQTIPMSEGGLVVYNGVQEAFIRGEYDGFTLLSSSSGRYMQRVSLLKNEKMQDILLASSSIELEVPMTATEFNAIVQNRVFWFDGSTYLWTEAQWSKDIARLSLSSLSTSIAPPSPPPPPYIPAEYQQVEWLKNRGASWINPNIQYTDSCDWEVRFIERDYRINNIPVVGSNQVGSTMVMNYWNGEVLLFWDKPRTAYYRPKYNEIAFVKLDYKFGGVIISSSLDEELNYTFVKEMTSNDIYINNSNGFNPSTNDAYLLNYFAFRDNGVLVRELIPCYRKSDLVAGMYDRVNGVFYTNAGTGSFIVGPDITT